MSRCWKACTKAIFTQPMLGLNGTRAPSSAALSHSRTSLPACLLAQLCTAAQAPLRSYTGNQMTYAAPRSWVFGGRSYLRVPDQVDNCGDVTDVGILYGLVGMRETTLRDADLRNLLLSEAVGPYGKRSATHQRAVGLRLGAVLLCGCPHDPGSALIAGHQRRRSKSEEAYTLL